MRLTSLYVSIVAASLHASGSAVSTSKIVVAAMSENKTPPAIVSSLRTNEERNVHADVKHDLGGARSGEARSNSKFAQKLLALSKRWFKLIKRTPKDPGERVRQPDRLAYHELSQKKYGELKVD